MSLIQNTNQSIIVPLPVVASNASLFELHPLVNTRIEYYDNGNPCPKGKTQFGLLIDIDYSKIRYNLNFLDNDDGTNYIQTGAKAGLFDDSETAIIYEMFRYFKLLEPHLDVTMTYGKFNSVAGQRHPTTDKPLYKLLPDYRVWALIIRNSFNPTAILFYGSDVHLLDAYGWKPPQSKNNAQLKWVVKI
jgi:hypothetical protein